MGFSSYKCAKSKKSIPAYPYAGFPAKASEVVLVLPEVTHKSVELNTGGKGGVTLGGGVIRGHYDGYGHIGNADIYEELGWIMFYARNRDDAFKGDRFEKIQEAVKMVRYDHYKGQRFNELKTSDTCQFQGYFYPDRSRKSIEDSLKKG